MATTTWTTVHLKIDGTSIDRERGNPPLELEVVPIGRALPKNEQRRLLRVRIGAAETEIDEDGIAAIVAFFGYTVP